MHLSRLLTHEPFFVYHAPFFSLTCHLFHVVLLMRVLVFTVCSGNWLFTGNFRACNVCTIQTIKCGAFRFPSQESFVHETYSMYHSNYQVWGFPLFTGNFHAHDVHTIRTTKCGAFQFSQEILVHAMYVPWPTDNAGARSIMSCLVMTNMLCI